MGPINKLCSNIFDIALAEDLDSSCRLHIVHVVLPIELEHKLEGDLGRRLELSLISCQVGCVHYGIQEIGRGLRIHPESQVSCLRGQVICEHSAHCGSDVERCWVLVKRRGISNHSVEGFIKVRDDGDIDRIQRLENCHVLSAYCLVLERHVCHGQSEVNYGLCKVWPVVIVSELHNQRILDLSPHSDLHASF